MSHAIFSDFRKLARAGDWESTFTLIRAMGAIDVACFEGSSDSLELSAAYVGVARRPDDARGYRELRALTAVRPMRIALRAEGRRDVQAKESGIAVEAQIGDEAFDARVFIDTPSEAPVVREVLGSREVRESVLWLLDHGFSSIELDNLFGRITATCTSVGAIRSAERAADALATIAANVPAVTPSSARHAPDHATAALVLSVLASVLCGAAAILAIFTLTPDACFVSDDEGTSLVCDEASCCVPLGYGLAIGSIVGLAAGLFVARNVRGRSNSHTRRRPIVLFFAIVGLELGLLIASLSRPFLG